MSGLQFFIHNDPEAVKFELAGKLAGVEVESVHQAWQREALTGQLKPLIVDITCITEADQYGRALLVIMHRFGARVIADSPESWAIAQPIVAQPSAATKPGLIRRLIRLLTEDLHALDLAGAELMSLARTERKASNTPNLAI